MSANWILKGREQERMLLTLLQEQADRELAALDVCVAAEPPHAFSEHFLQWLDEFILRTDEIQKRHFRWQNAAKWAAMIALIVGVMASVMLLGNEEIQAKVRDFLFQWKKGSNELEINPEEGRGDPTSEAAQAWLAKEPEYVPEGYEEISYLEGPGFKRYRYTNKEGYECAIHIYLYTEEMHHTFGFDNEHSIEQIFKHEGYVFNVFDSIDLKYYPTTVFYEMENDLGYVIISGYLDWEELYKIFEGIVIS